MQGDRFDGHDGEVFWRREVRNAKGMPEDHVGVVDALVAVLLDPFGKPSGGVAGGLWHVPARRVDLIVVIWSGGVLATCHAAMTRDRNGYIW